MISDTLVSPTDKKITQSLSVEFRAHFLGMEFSNLFRASLAKALDRHSLSRTPEAGRTIVSKAQLALLSCSSYFPAVVRTGMPRSQNIFWVIDIMAEIDFADLEAKERYKLLVGAVVPRPIALVTTVSDGGLVNAAPFSFFNAVCNDPPAVFVGVNSDAGGREKDTAANIRRSEEFVVNMVDEALSPLMNLCEVEFPHSISEIASVGLNTVPSRQVAAPRLAAAPISFECKLLQTVSLAPGKAMFIGRVLGMYLDDRLYDAEKNYILSDRAGIVGRMHGAGAYVRTTDLFDMPRLSPQEKQRRFGTLLDAPRSGEGSRGTK